ncbi:MAG: transcriptional regulator [Betaproteobacteria bacterium]
MGAIEIEKIAKRYKALCELVPLKPITGKTEYIAAIENLNELLDAGGANEAHPLAGLVEALGALIQSWEKRQAPMAEAEPREVLRYLMAEHGLRQTDLAGFASQGTISDILGGRRAISRALAKKLAVRFHLPAGAFI